MCRSAVSSQHLPVIVAPIPESRAQSLVRRRLAAKTSGPPTDGSDSAEQVKAQIANSAGDEGRRDVTKLIDGWLPSPPPPPISRPPLLPNPTPRLPRRLSSPSLAARADVVALIHWPHAASAGRTLAKLPGNLRLPEPALDRAR